jgi:hypothetical protein
MKPIRAYPVFGPEKSLPPDFQRVVRRLSDRELCSELEAQRGAQDYLKAVSVEIDRRRGL